MHGLALTMLTQKESRHFIAKSVLRKPIDMLDYAGAHTWNKLESLTYSGRIRIGVLSRF